MSEAVDSLLHKLPVNLDIQKGFKVEAEKDEIKEVIEEQLNVLFGNSGNEHLTVRVTDFKFRYPRAYRDGLFGERLIERSVSMSLFFKVANDSVYALQEHIYHTGTFPSSEKQTVESQGFEAEVENYAFSYILWEPVLMALGTVGLTYLFFVGR